MTRAVCTLRAIRQARGLRREDVAAASGLNITTVGKLETVTADKLERLTLGTVFRVAQALEIPACELIPSLIARPRAR